MNDANRQRESLTPNISPSYYYGLLTGVSSAALLAAGANIVTDGPSTLNVPAAAATAAFVLLYAGKEINRSSTE